MQPTYYGVDIVLRPEAERGRALCDQGKVIEINGRNSGASFYKIGRFEPYQRIMQSLSESVNGKIILLNYDPEQEFHHQMSDITLESRKEGYRDQKARLEAWQRHLEQDADNVFYSVRDFMLDRLRWEEQTANKFKQPFNRYLLNAAAELGVPVRTSIQNTFFAGLAKIVQKNLDPQYEATLPPRELTKDIPRAYLNPGEVPPAIYTSEFLPVEKIGLVWDDSTPRGEKTVGRNRFLNGWMEERIMNDKALLYGFSSLLPEGKRPFEQFLPSSMLYGMGLHTQEEFQKLIRESEAKLFVKKPLTESHGIGIEFIYRDDMKKYDRSPYKTTETELIAKSYRNLLLDFILGSAPVARDTIIFQEAINSKEVVDPDTGKHYPACARAIVVNGRYVGAMWRSNARDEGSLTELYRHNVTNGGTIFPVEAKDHTLLGEIAEASVAAFEESIENLREQATDKQVPFLESIADSKDFDLTFAWLCNSYYLTKMKHAAAHAGIKLEDLLSQWEEKQGCGELDFSKKTKEYLRNL